MIATGARVDRQAIEEARAARCAVCGAEGLDAFYGVDGVPTQSCVLLDSESEAAAYPAGDLLLALCRQCGFIQNVRFESAIVDYSKPTEESQAFSGRFQAFAGDLATRLVERHGLVGGSVLEVGCGKGDFMRLLSDRGVSSGVGIDPGFLPGRVDGDSGEIRFVRDWYDERHVELTADLVLTRHLLEHVPNVGEFLSWLVVSTQRTPGAPLFTEVPDVARVLDEGAFWDVYYEHCAYFTLGSLGRALRHAGLRVDELELAFDDQYILASAVPAPGAEPHPAEEPVSAIVPKVDSFAQVAARSRAAWLARVKDVIDGGGRVCIWGGGSKAVAFLTTLGLTDHADQLLVVDINTHKQGKWLPGTQTPVSPPARLATEPPHLVIPMNSVYVDEIRADLERMGLSPIVEPV